MKRITRILVLGACCVQWTLTAPGSTHGDIARPTFYIYHGAEKSLALDPTRIAIRWRGGAATRALPGFDGAPSAPAAAHATPTGVGGWAMLAVGEGDSKTNANPAPAVNLPASDAERIGEKIATALSMPDVAFASPVFHGEDGGWIIVTPELLMQMRPGIAGAAAVLDELSSVADVADPHLGNLEGAVRLHCHARDGFEVLEIANRLARDPRVAWAEPDMQFTCRHQAAPPAQHATFIPDDPLFGNAWGLQNTGQFGGTPGMDMGAPAAWDITTGNPSVKVLVLDVGVQQDHPDLDVAPGADFTGQAGGGGPVGACDNHGTTVAGCIAARIDNGIGVTGIAPDCPVLSARIGISDGACNGSFASQSDWTVYALAWGLVRGARVSNNSNGYGFTSNAIDAAYASTHDGGMVHFSSAGNGGPGPLGYPASLPEVLAVGALVSTGQLAPFTNFGPSVEFMAPGADVFTTDRTGSAGWVNGDYTFASGTSFSSPYAAGVAALIASQDTTRTAPQIEQLLALGCRDLGAPGDDEVYGHGFVNAYNSLALGRAQALAVGDAPGPIAFEPGRPNPFTTRIALGFSLAAPCRASLQVFDARGRRVRSLGDGFYAAGRHEARWDGTGESGSAAPAGIYFVRMAAGPLTRTIKIVRIEAPRE